MSISHVKTLVHLVDPLLLEVPTEFKDLEESLAPELRFPNKKSPKQIYANSSNTMILLYPETVQIPNGDISLKEEKLSVEMEKEAKARFHFDACHDASLGTLDFLNETNLPQLIDQAFNGFHVGIFSLGIESHPHINDTAKQTTSHNRQAFLLSAFQSFRNTFEEASNHFDINFAFCFFGISDNKIIDYATNECIPSSMIVDAQVTLDDLYIQGDSLEEIESMLSKGRIFSSVLLVKLVLDPKDSNLEENSNESILSYEGSICFADFGVYENEANNSASNFNKIRQTTIPKSLNHLKNLALLRNQPFLSANLDYENNHITSLLAEYLGGASNTCQSCLVLFPDCRSGLTATHPLEAFRFGEIVRGIKCHPQQHSTDIRPLLKLERYEIDLKRVNKELSEITKTSQQLESQLTMNMDNLTKVKELLDVSSSTRNLLEAEAEYNNSHTIFTDIEAEMERNQWNAENLVRQFKLRVDEELVAELQSENDVLTSELSGLQTISKAYKVESNELSASKEAKINQLTEKLGSLEATLLSSKDERSVLQTKLSQLSRSLEDKAIELEKARQASDKANRDLDYIRSTQKDSQNNHQLAIREQALQLDVLRKDISWLEKERAHLGRRLEEMEREGRSLEKANIKLDLELTAARASNASIHGQLSNGIQRERENMEMNLLLQKKMEDLEKKWGSAYSSYKPTNLLGEESHNLDKSNKNISQVERSSQSHNSHPQTETSSKSNKEYGSVAPNRPSPDEFSFSKQTMHEFATEPTKKQKKNSVDSFKSNVNKNDTNIANEEPPTVQSVGRPRKSLNKRKSIVMPKSVRNDSSENLGLSNEGSLLDDDSVVTEETLTSSRKSVGPGKNRSTGQASRKQAELQSGKKLDAASDAHGPAAGNKSINLTGKQNVSEKSLEKSKQSNPTNSSSKFTGPLQKSAGLKLSNPTSSDISSENSGFLANLSLVSSSEQQTNSSKIKLHKLLPTVSAQNLTSSVPPPSANKSLLSTIRAGFQIKAPPAAL